MIHEAGLDLKKRLRLAGLKVLDFTEVLQEPYGTIAGRLNGYLPLSDDTKKKIINKIEEAEALKAIRNVKKPKKLKGAKNE